MTDPILEAFDRLARRQGDRALVVASSGAALAGEIHAASLLLAKRLAVGGPEEPVALLAPGGACFLAALAGIRRAGRPVLFLDPGLPEGERARTAHRYGAADLLCVTGPALADLAAAPIERLDAPLGAPLAGTGYIKLTSGSSGEPRGIHLTPEALAADEAALFDSMGLREDDRVLATVPLSHSYGLSSIALPALVRGMTLVQPPPAGGGDPFAPLEWAGRHGATVFPTTPAWLHAVARLAEAPPWPGSLRLIVSAGAPLRPETAARIRERFDRRVHAFYGASECGGICYDRSGDAGERGSVGEPVAGVRLSLASVDAETPGVPAAGAGAANGGSGPIDPGGSVGIVQVESPAVATGYWPADPGRLSGGRFRSSDLGRLEGRRLVLAGRADDLIIVRGKNVHPGEVERVLGQLEGVDEAVALGVVRPEGGDPVLRAVIACAPGRLTREAVLDWCRSRLADHKLPRSIVFAASIPRTERGKIDRQALARWDGDPTGS